MISVGIVGASGYTGAELMRLLCAHPGFEVVAVTAHKYAGERVSSLYPSLAGFYDGDFEEYDGDRIAGSCEAVFVGLPHGESMKVVPELAEAGSKVVDLSADFRFDDAVHYEKWYGVRHQAPHLLPEAVYGLPEVKRDVIGEARIVANPGCYPTACLLGVFPVARAGLIGGTVVVDAKSGVSGAGRKLTLDTHYPQVADGMTPYAVVKHRHQPEMKAELGKMLSEGEPDLLFVPHLAPMNRGILCTLYVPLGRAAEELEVRELYQTAYADETFVRLLPEGEYPSTKAVQGSNNCHVSVALPGEGGTLVVMTAIDNLVKGASGQAVQNMNILFGLAEETGLSGPGLFP